MPVNIIQGAIGAGKSALCLNQIERLHERKPDAHCIMIVPEHYSYDTEKRFVEKFGGTGLNNIEVLTLRKMAMNHLKASELKHISGAGRQMLIYKAVNEFCDRAESEKEEKGFDARLIASMRKDGFLDAAGSLISEMKRYTVTPEMLHSAADGDNETLRQKLTALSEIYAAYSDFIETSGCVDGEDDLDRLAELIEAGGVVGAGTYVWVDKFDEFLPHQLRVIEAMLKRGADITLSVISPEPDGETSRALAKADDLAFVYGLNERYVLNEELNHVKNNPELYFLFKNWGDSKAVYEDEVHNITLFESRDAYGEIERAACKILDLVREDGLRFRDIALLCGNTEEYRHLIETIFEEYSIPYFSDSTIALSDHPIAMQVLSLFDIFRDNWTYETVFKYLRAGFIYETAENGLRTLSQGRVDELENYVLRYGIRGGTKWLGGEPWKIESGIISRAFGIAEDEKENERVETLRQQIIEPIKRFKDATSGRRTAREHAAALYEYFEDIHLYDGLKSEVHRLRKNDRLDEAEQFTKLWNLLLDVLNQTVVSVGNEKMNRLQYADYIRAGLSKCEIRIIPSGIDQVYVGDVERSSQSNVRAMFVIGAVNGTFPSDIPAEGFLSNNDRSVLEERGIHVAPDTKKKAERQYFKVYRALCAATEKLFLSYPLQTGDGKALRASRMLLDIHNMFPKMTVKDNLLDDMNNKIYISSPDATIHRMIVAKSTRNPNRINPIWDAAYKWYENKDEWKGLLSLVDTAEKFAARGISLDEDTAKRLYEGNSVYSASRLNAFARCPYGYFAQYGLGARERVEWEITPADAGTYAHEVIKKFVERVEDGAQTPAEKLKKWKNLAEEKTDENTVTRNDILNEIIESTCENILAASSRDKERTASIFRRMGKTIAGAAGIVHRSLKNGEYTENGLERKFEIELGGGVKVKGIIDRLDMYKPDGGDARVRIVDYKTGGTSFDIVDIFNGLNLQPVIYAIAARKMAAEEFNGSAIVTGIYYNKVRDDFQKLDITDADEKAAANHEKERRLDGVTFIEDSGSRRFIDEMDNISGDEKFLNIELKVNGDIKTPDSVKTQSEINGLMDFVGESIVKMDSEIKSGNISLAPYRYRTDKPLCSDCAYSPMCGFFSDKRTAREKAGKKGDIWDEMAERGRKKKQEQDESNGKEAGSDA